MNFGIPYMGNKADIVESLALNFPAAENFYDLFGGGFSVTHYMLTNKAHKYKYFHYNEIVPSTVELVKKAINGDFNYDKFKPEWISREDFFKRIDDPYVRIIWSFGNNQKDYMFNEDIEKYKKSLHMAVVFNEFDSISKKVLGFDKWPKQVDSIFKKIIYCRQKVRHDSKQKGRGQLQQLQRLQRLQQLQQLEQLERLQQLEQLQRLQRLQQLEQLQQLQQLERLTITSLDYRDVIIKPNSVVYCDIPYKGTAGYLGNFNHKEFYDWAATREFPVYISEYNIEDSRFKLIYKVDKTVKLSQKGQTKSDGNEKLYINPYAQNHNQ
jgi:hypothetical protein